MSALFLPALSLPFFGGYGFSLGAMVSFFYIWGRTHWCSFVELVGILYLAFKASEYNFGAFRNMFSLAKDLLPVICNTMSRLSIGLLLIVKRGLSNYLTLEKNPFCFFFGLSFCFLGAILFRICIPLPSRPACHRKLTRTYHVFLCRRGLRRDYIRPRLVEPATKQSYMWVGLVGNTMREPVT